MSQPAEIDLRRFVAALVRRKWFVAAVTMVAGLLGYALGVVKPREYEAETQVIVALPVLVANIDPNADLSPKLPDPKGLRDLAMSPDLLDQARRGSSGDSTPQWRAAAVGNTQVRLSVADTDPRRAANLVNAWARAFSGRLNSLYGMDESRMAGIEQQIAAAKSNWTEAGRQVVEFLPQSRVEALMAEHTGMTDGLIELRAKLRAGESLLSDAHTVLAMWADRDASERLPQGDVLMLLALQQRVADTGNAQNRQTTLQLPDTQYTIGAGRTALNQLIRARQAQEQDIVNSLPGREAATAALAAQLEVAQEKLVDLTERRDATFRAYQTMSHQLEETRISLAQNGPTARSTGLATPPATPTASRPKINAMLGAMLGFMLAVMFVIVREWWRVPAQP